jgi:hypothetical protein
MSLAYNLHTHNKAFALFPWAEHSAPAHLLRNQADQQRYHFSLKSLPFELMQK